MKRSPAVAGHFYHSSSPRLTQQVDQYLDADAPQEQAIGVLVPHAGLIYSGAVAGAVYSSIVFPKTFVMLGPNHTGLGPKISLMDSGQWEIPTGALEIDMKLSGKIAMQAASAVRDTQAHAFEHSLEVQLPFIARRQPATKIVPLSIMSASVDDCRSLAEAIAGAVKSVDYPVVVLASSDMSHYLPEKTARQKDKRALDRILALDPEGLYRTVVDERISMCGYLPATVMLFAAGFLGAGSARLVRYMTSGDVSGDYDSVVGYAGVLVR